MNCSLSVWLDYYGDLPVEEAIEKLAAAGFGYAEISLTHMEALMRQKAPAAAGKALRQCADGCGMQITQGHLSFRGGLCDDAALERLMPELDLFAAAGIRKAVLHTGGGQQLSPQERYDRWVHYLRKLSEYVEGADIALCIENLYTVPQCSTATDIKGIIADAGGKNLAICLDTGHLHLSRVNGVTTQTQREFILEAGELLQALHITDNNGDADTHQMPYSARYGVDWIEVMGALRQVDYRGLFNLEILGERNAPMVIREAKLPFIRTMCDYLNSEEFLTCGFRPFVIHPNLRGAQPNQK